MSKFLPERPRPPSFRSLVILLLFLSLAPAVAAQRTGVNASPGVMVDSWSTSFTSGDIGWGWNEPLATEDLDADGFEDLVFAELGWRNQAKVIAWSATDGRVLWSATYAGGYYNAVAGHPDQNGDGMGDVLLGGPGLVHVRSGLDGSILQSIQGVGSWDGFGDSVSAVDDVTGDGVAEILVGARWTSVGFNWAAGSAFLYSGAAPWQAPIMRVDGANSYDMLGTAVAGIGDLNGDGVPDFLIGAPGTNSNVGSIFAFSGDPLNQGQIWRADGVPGGEMGYWIQPMDDLNGDGIQEVVADSAILSGADGTVFRPFDEGEVIEDVDGDGVQDLIGGSGGLFPGPTVFPAAVFSGASGAVLFAVSEGSLADEEIWVAGGPDVNGDGLHETYSIVFPDWGDPMVFLGQVNAGLSISTDTISLAAGGPLGIHLDFAPQTAFQEYRIVTSASGTGFLPVSVMLLLPLKYDQTVYQTYNGDYPVFASAMSGMLNSQGQGVGTINFPAGLPPSLLGLTYTVAGMAGYPWGFWTATTFSASYTFVP